ncbi:MAG: UbiA family prenyltransferase, partial [Rhodanobacteraceae bacterium]
MTEVDSDVARTPLCVDLDGTLLLGDVGVESALALIKQNPLYLFAMLLWLLKGYAVLKRNIARRVTLNVATLPYDERVLAWVRAEQGTRPCLLVTASDDLLVQPIAEHLDCFSEVLASDGVTNLAGTAKAQALEARFGKYGFDYAGNSSSDLAVWPHARTVIVANPSAPLLRRIRKTFSVGKLFPRQTRGLRTWVRAMRLHQWVKNLLLFVPLIGAHRLEDGALVAQCLVAWLLFGMCTSGTYLGNDLLDLDADRRHPRKRFRPLASGRLPVQDGLIAAYGLIAGSFLAALLLLPLAFSAWLAAYLLLTLTYSLRLKRIIVVDVIVLAL